MCRFESVVVLKSVTTCGQFVASNGKPFAIHSMTAAYNMNTKDTRIYAEFERMGENVVEDNMRKMGAGSFRIDTFSKDNWDSDSATALKSVIECGEGPGYTLIRYGREPLAGNQAELGVSGGGEASGDDDDHEPHTRPSGLDHGGESKRQRTASPSGREMVSYDVMVGTFKAVIESAVASTGSAVSSAFASERERSEQAERQVREYKLKEDRRRIEEEVAGRYRAEIEGMKAKVEGVGETVGDLKEKHDAEMKAKEDAHAAELKTAKEVIVCFQLILIP